MFLRLSAMYKNKIISSEDLQGFQEESIRQIEDW